MKRKLSCFKTYALIYFAFFLAVVLYKIYLSGLAIPAAPPSYDINEIYKRGKLVALLEKNSTDYYIYNGKPMGFQYELLHRFAESLKLPLEIIIEDNQAKALQMLHTAKCDVIASNLNILKETKKHCTFTRPLFQTKQVLVQRRVSGKNKVNSPLELASKTVSVKSGSAYHNRLINLSEEIGDTIYIDQSNDYNTEELIKLVAAGKKDYTIANEYIAKANAAYYPNIDYSVAVSLDQNSAWIIRKNTPQLEKVINQWLDSIVGNAFYKAIYYKYFESETQVQIFRSDFCSLNSNKISVYDEALKKCSKLIGWDWRLLASLVYQESKFNTDTVSRRGAFGLMQLMPITAQRFEVDSVSSPEDNIKAGVMYIRWLDKQLINKVADKEERQKFILAAYNIGLGHVFDAQALARKHGRNYQVWDNNVDFFLLNKSKPLYINDTLVRNGPVKGKETFAFVRKVFERYHHYKNLIKE